MNFQYHPFSLSLLRSLGPIEIVHVDRVLEEQLGLTSDEIAAQPLIDWIHPEDRAVIKEALDSGAGYAWARHRTKHHDWVPFDWQVETADGGVFVLGRLASESPMSPASFAPSKSNTQAEALEAMALVVEAKNPEMRCSILLVDSATRRVTVGAGPSLPAEYNEAVEGLQIGPAVGSCGTAAFWNVPVIVDNIAEDPLWRNLRGTASIAGVCACWSHPITATDGTVLGALALYADEPKFPDEGQMDGLEIAARMVGIALERDRLQEQLRRSSKLEAIGRLAGGIAHDFNNYLTAIVGNLDLAMLGLAPDDERRPLILAAQNASLRARDVTQQLLTFASGGAPVTSAQSPIELARETVDFSLAGSNVRYEMRFGSEIKNVEVDRGQASQVIQNVVLNAVQAMPEGGDIVVSAENVPAESLPHSESSGSGEFVRLSIADQGLGIPEHHLTRIFDPFFSTKDQGRGLGLATTYSIMKRHGGQLTADSTMGKGTTVQLYFPVAQREAQPLDPDVEPLLCPVGRVLVMDDEESVRDLLKRMLVMHGGEVTLASDGSEAIRMFEQARGEEKPFDLVILDLTIPGGMGGVVALSHLRKLDPEVRAVATSGYADSPILSEHAAHGFACSLKKPYLLEDLKTLLSSVSGDV